MSTTACTDHTDLFQLLDDLPAEEVDVDQPKLPLYDVPIARRIAEMFGCGAGWQEALDEARALCAACPLVEACLFQAVTDQAVTGVVAGTTEADRKLIRRRLGLGPYKEDDLDIYLLPRRAHDTVDPDRVAAMTSAGMLSQTEMARELGCSTRTIRRRQRSSHNVRRRPRRDPLTPRKVLNAAEELLPWF